MKTFEEFIRERYAELLKENPSGYAEIKCLSLKHTVQLVDIWQKLNKHIVMCSQSGVSPETTMKKLKWQNHKQVRFENDVGCALVSITPEEKLSHRSAYKSFRHFYDFVVSHFSVRKFFH